MATLTAMTEKSSPRSITSTPFTSTGHRSKRIDTFLHRPTSSSSFSRCSLLHLSDHEPTKKRMNSGLKEGHDTTFNMCFPPSGYVHIGMFSHSFLYS